MERGWSAVDALLFEVAGLFGEPHRTSWLKCFGRCPPDPGGERPNRIVARIREHRPAPPQVPDFTLSPRIQAAPSVRDDVTRRDLVLGVVSGCFDLLHPGHIELLTQARRHLDRHPRAALCVLLLGDADVTRKKGRDRPVLDINERMALLLALDIASYIVPLTRPDCLEALDILRPACYFKEEHDRNNSVVQDELRLVQAAGGRTVLLHLPNTVHTTDIIRQLRKDADSNLSIPPPAAPPWESGFRSRAAAHFPPIVNVEVIRGLCPCRCVHCPVGRTPPLERRSSFGEAVMQLGLFRKIVDEMALHPGTCLRIHGVGDPLLWPDLVDALQAARSMGVATWLFTSGVIADTDGWQRVCEEIGLLEISLNGVDRDDYHKTKGIDAYPLVVANIRRARLAMKQAQRGRLVVTRVESDNATSDAAFVASWKGSGIADDAFIRSYHTYNEQVPPLDAAADVAAAGAAAGVKRGGRRPPCLVHWGRFNVDVSGRAVVCFNELFRPALDAAVVLGDLRRDDIASLWRGPRLESIRRAEWTGDYEGVDRAERIPCFRCTLCQPLAGSTPTSESQLGGLHP